MVYSKVIEIKKALCNFLVIDKESITITMIKNISKSFQYENKISALYYLIFYNVKGEDALRACKVRVTSKNVLTFEILKNPNGIPYKFNEITNVFVLRYIVPVHLEEHEKNHYLDHINMTVIVIIHKTKISIMIEYDRCFASYEISYDDELPKSPDYIDIIRNFSPNTTKDSKDYSLVYYFITENLVTQAYYLDLSQIIKELIDSGDVKEEITTNCNTFNKRVGNFSYIKKKLNDSVSYYKHKKMESKIKKKYDFDKNEYVYEIYFNLTDNDHFEISLIDGLSLKVKKQTLNMKKYTSMYFNKNNMEIFFIDNNNQFCIFKLKEIYNDIAEMRIISESKRKDKALAMFRGQDFYEPDIDRYDINISPKLIQQFELDTQRIVLYNSYPDHPMLIKPNLYRYFFNKKNLIVLSYEKEDKKLLFLYSLFENQFNLLKIVDISKGFNVEYTYFEDYLTLYNSDRMYITNL